MTNEVLTISTAGAEATLPKLHGRVVRKKWLYSLLTFHQRETLADRPSRISDSDDAAREPVRQAKLGLSQRCLRLLRPLRLKGINAKKHDSRREHKENVVRKQSTIFINSLPRSHERIIQFVGRNFQRGGKKQWPA
jgi:hypothetical protein